MGKEIVLWLFVINLGIAFGAGLYEARGIVKLLRLRPSSGTRGSLSGPLSPLCRPFRARHFRPTLEPICHLCTILRRRYQMPLRSEVLGNRPISRQKPLGMTG